MGDCADLVAADRSLDALSRWCTSSPSGYVEGVLAGDRAQSGHH